MSTLPEACLTLPIKAQEFLKELLDYAQYLVTQNQYHAATHSVSFHAPQWLLAEAHKVHPDTLRRWFKLTATKLVAACTPHKVRGRKENINDGMVWTVLIKPDGVKQAQVFFERNTKYRDLRVDAANGRLRESYTLIEGGVKQNLIEWQDTKIEPNNKPYDNDSRTPAFDAASVAVDAVEQVRYIRTPKAVERAAYAIRRALRDNSIKAHRTYLKALWALVKTRQLDKWSKFCERLRGLERALESGEQFNAGAQMVKTCVQLELLQRNLNAKPKPNT